MNFYTKTYYAQLWQTVLTLETLTSLLLSVALGAIVGIERERAHRPAGLRTHMLVSLGSCLFTIASTSFNAQPAQVAGGIVAGIGFIGAGTIWAEKDKVKGITTAASLWATAAIGLATGLGDFPLAATATLLVFIVLASKYVFWRLGVEKREDESKNNSG
jgi:putative Mg2+ transporter-C (MgtC) family protein